MFCGWSIVFLIELVLFERASFFNAAILIDGAEYKHKVMDKLGIQPGLPWSKAE